MMLSPNVFQQIMYIFICLLLLSCLTSCHPHQLSVQSQYFTHQNLASYHVGTPDPRLDIPMIGQRLLIQWTLCDEQMQGENVILVLHVRFRNRTEDKKMIPITKKTGTYLYTLKDTDFTSTEGILTYIAEIQSDCGVLASWKHPLWAPLIVFDQSDENQEITGY